MTYIIDTPCGKVRGTKGSRSGTIEFKGIRYATAGRWEYPTPVTSWEGVYDATSFGHCAYQPRAFYGAGNTPSDLFYFKEFHEGQEYTYSEDCLFLNIFAPDDITTEDNLPVLVFIHGGWFVSGCSNEMHFDAPSWPEKDVIGVTINYRLGPLGFACMPELKEEAGKTGNYGLYDQIAALSWIKNNISAFGGDPDNITIMGQSAGAMSVEWHCLNTETDGLFNKAIMISGGGLIEEDSALPPESHYVFWKQCMKNAGCCSLEEFRKVSAKELFTAWQETQVQLGIEMEFSSFYSLFVVKDEDANSSPPASKNMNYMIGSTAVDLTPLNLLARAIKWCGSASKSSYAWLFDRSLPGDNYGPWHSSDLWYWFGTLGKCWRPMTEKDHLLSEQMTSFLCNFVKTGNPNGDNLPVWTPAGDAVMCLGDRDPAMILPPYSYMLRKRAVTKEIGE
ncbi:MAG: carboxylesterase family protein [Firmicutes bacterium]|nr:carboxylesterase family protein [Bacillota bacterium]